MTRFWIEFLNKYSGALQLESELTLRERAELQHVARRELELLIERSVPDRPVATLLGKIEGGLDHWLTF